MVIRPPWLFQTTWIYHITHIQNLPKILESGKLVCKNSLREEAVDISLGNVQRKRSAKEVVLPPGGRLHDYVPFYFAPRSPMLFKNHRCACTENYKPQHEIIHLVTTAEHAANRHAFVFYDHHAISYRAKPYHRLTDLTAIEWDLFFEPPIIGEYAKYWQNKDDPRNPKWNYREEVRQAEFLVYRELPWQEILKIGVLNSEVARKTVAILEKHNQGTLVETKPEWYF
jgi:hypothetical protein